jgi:SNF2 family DNA or RNA helicase
LTGTPAAQSPTAAYGLARLVNPTGVPSHFGAFQARVLIKVAQYKWVNAPDAQEIVHRALQPAIRFTQEECIELPEIIYSEREVPFTAQQIKYYALLKEELTMQAAGTAITAVNAAVGMQKLLQISMGSVYADDGGIVDFDCTPRFMELLAVIEEASHKVLVMCPYKHTLKRICAFLESKKISSAEIHGDVPNKIRTQIVDDFQTRTDPHVLVMQPKTAAHGLTLTAASVIVWFGPVDSAETYLQGNKRHHRTGQKHPCSVIHLVSSEAERLRYRALASKTEDQDAILDMYKKVLAS